jgi:Uma2 family endonuclease
MNEKANRGMAKIKEEPAPYGDLDRFEVIDHIVFELKPAPSTNHQRIIAHLFQSLNESCHPNGETLFAPIDVYLDEGNCLQPDLVFILNENSHIIKEERIEGAPDLVAEVLSPATSGNDKIRKKAVYERFGVKEFWVVDPFHRLIDQFVLKDGKYELHRTYDEQGMLTSPLFSCVSIDLKRIFARIPKRA